MRIVYPVLWSRPDRKACRAQTMNTVAALSRRGHDIALLMPRGTVDPELSPDDLRRYFQVEGAFRLIQRSSRWAGDSLARSLMWLRQVLADPETHGADLLYSRIPAMLGAGQLSPVPFATDHYRPWPDEWPAIRPLLRQTARDGNCAGFIIHSDFAAASYRRAGISEELVLVAHNGAEPQVEAPERIEARARLGLPKRRAIAVYAGRVSERKGLDQVLKMAELRSEILFLLVGSEGDGPIERQAARRENVRTVGWVAPTDLPAWLAAADVLLIPPSRAPLERFRQSVLPIKLYAYLAAGRPILAPLSPDTSELLESEGNALLVPPERPDMAAAALDRLLGEPGLAERLGDAARRQSAGLTWDRRAERISNFLESRLRTITEPRAGVRPRLAAVGRAGARRGCDAAPTAPAPGSAAPSR